MGARVEGARKRNARLVHQSSIENRQSTITCAYLTVVGRNPQAVEKALMNKAWGGWHRHSCLCHG
jgi:hypothetical protein